MEERWIEESKKIVNLIFTLKNLTQADAAKILGLTQGNFSRKLNQGTLRLTELMKLLDSQNLYIDIKNKPSFDLNAFFQHLPHVKDIFEGVTFKNITPSDTSTSEPTPPINLEKINKGFQEIEEQQKKMKETNKK